MAFMVKSLNFHSKFWRENFILSQAEIPKALNLLVVTFLKCFSRTNDYAFICNQLLELVQDISYH